MLKTGCTLQNLANICLHKYTAEKIYPSTEADKDILKKVPQDVVGSPFIVVTRKAVIDETLIRKSVKYAKVMSELMLTNYTHSRCVNQNRPNFVRVGISILKPVYSLFVKTRPTASEKWSFPFFKKKTRL